MWIIFKVSTEFTAVLLLFYVLVFWLQAMWDLSCLTRNLTHTPCIRRRSLTWMESVMQSDVSQKEKSKYCILMHICGI